MQVAFFTHYSEAEYTFEVAPCDLEAVRGLFDYAALAGLVVSIDGEAGCVYIGQGGCRQHRRVDGGEIAVAFVIRPLEFCNQLIIDHLTQAEQRRKAALERVLCARAAKIATERYCHEPQHC